MGFSEATPAFDFSDKLNVEELKLKDPTNLKHLNLCNAIQNAIDIAMEKDSK